MPRKTARTAPRKNHVATIGIGAAWLVGTAAAVRFAELTVGRNPLVAALIGAVIVDLATYRVGVRWDPDQSTGPEPRRRALRGIALGLGVALLLVTIPLVFGVVSGAATVAKGSPSGSLVFGLLRAAAVGTRDELLLRGVPLVIAARVGLGARFGIGYAALASVAAVALAPSATWESLVLAAAQGTLFAVLWARTGVAWASVAAHAGWVLFAGVGLRGGVVEVAWANGLLADGTRARGTVALVAAFVAAAFAGAAWKRLPQREVSGPELSEEKQPG